MVKSSVFCRCGCERVTETYTRTRKRLGHVKGQHKPFINGHRTIPASTRAIWSAQRKGRKPSEETRAKLSAIRRGRSTAAWAHKVGAAQLGKPKPFRGEKHYNWKGGVERDRGPEAHAWAKAVKRRDKHTCQKCGHRSTRGMHAHHLWPYAEYPEKRHDVDNGVTLCATCHYSPGIHKTPSHLRDLFFGVEPAKPHAI